MIIQNAIMITENWPEVSFLVSSHVHDFQTYTFKDGSDVSVDGGKEYIRRLFNENRSGYGTNWVEYCLDDTEPLDAIKRRLLWGTRGKDGRQPFKYVRLVDCETSHLQAILDTQTVSPIYMKVIRSILEEKESVVMKKQVRKPKAATYIHKAVRPKYEYLNPTLCAADIDDKTAQKNSRTRWNYVTCPECWKKRMK